MLYFTVLHCAGRVLVGVGGGGGDVLHVPVSWASVVGVGGLGRFDFIFL